jgi:hypothetical protein
MSVHKIIEVYTESELKKIDVHTECVHTIF